MLDSMQNAEIIGKLTKEFNEVCLNLWTIKMGLKVVGI